MERGTPPRLIGTSCERLDAWDKVSGRACYVDDLQLPGAWVGGTLRSPVARGRLRGDWVEGRARMVNDPEGVELGLGAIQRKYGWQMRLVLLASRLSGRYAQRGVIEIRVPPPEAG